MIPQVKALLEAQDVTRVVIVDDAFDDGPQPGDLADTLWNPFFDDWTYDDEVAIAAAYGIDALPEAEPLTLARDPEFISALWRVRGEVAAAVPLFEEFARLQIAKRAELQPLRDLLEQDLSLNCVTVGREQSADVGEAQILFLDLFLGFVEAQEAIDTAIARVKGVVAGRRDDPPIVVLLSRSPQLQELGPDVRDRAELLGCQFRMVRKADLQDRPAMAERLYDLVRSRPDAMKLNGFINAWDTALLSSREQFLKSIRTFDLADYANTQALILEAEEEPLGDYVLDLYDLHLHNTLEGHADLVRAAKALNQIKLADYPPGQFMPPEEVVLMMDGAFFQNQIRTDTEAEVDNNPSIVRLGDVFLAPIAPPKGRRRAAAGADAVQLPREVFVVLSQACDLQHGGGDQLLLLRGSARPYAAAEGPKKHSGPKTSIMRVDETDYQVEWDVLSPQTWSLKDLPKRVAKGTRRIRRFRTPYALQLQQSFIGKLGRVGTLATLPGRHSVGVRILLRTKTGEARLLVQRGLSEGDAVALVGRTNKGAVIDWLLLSPALLEDFGQALRDVDAADLPTGTPKIGDVRDDPQFYRLLKRGLPFSRQAPAGKKPLVETAYKNVVEIFAAQSPVANGALTAANSPIIIEIGWQ
jgi:hypothetical protein